MDCSSSASGTPNSMASLDASLEAPLEASVENALISFGNLGLRNDSVENSQAGSSRGDMPSCLPSDVSLDKTQETEIDFDPRQRTSLDGLPTVPTGETQQLPSTPFIPRCLWLGHNCSSNGGDFLAIGSSVDSMNCTNNLHPAIVRQSSFVNHQFEATGRNGIYVDNGDHELMQICEIVELAMTQEGSQYLQKILTRRNLQMTNIIVNAVLNFPFELLTDQYGHRLFQRLIESCNFYQTQQIVLRITSQIGLLIAASKHIYGSHSIQRLIKMLKRSPLVDLVILPLSIAFYPLMIHQTGRHVIRQCFIILDSKQNELLYEAALRYYAELATHEWGCISLNDCVDYIRGPHRGRLLTAISNHAVYLSLEPSGNYVLQHVLALENPVFTQDICSRLQGHYVKLSLHKNGSHVVERCLNSKGMSYVVEELVTSDRLSQVARDQFGNYVIQTALKVTKLTNMRYHQSLVEALRPHFNSLKCHQNGKNVFYLINSGFETKA